MLKTDISAWISWISSSVDSRSIYVKLVSPGCCRGHDSDRDGMLGTDMFDRDHLSSRLLDAFIDYTKTTAYIHRSKVSI